MPRDWVSCGLGTRPSRAALMQQVQQQEPAARGREGGAAVHGCSRGSRLGHGPVAATAACVYLPYCLPPECGTQQWPLVAGDREATGERALFPSGFSVGASSIQTRSCLVTGGPTYTPWGSGQHPWPPPSGYQGHTQL